MSPYRLCPKGPPIGLTYETRIDVLVVTGSVGHQSVRLRPRVDRLYGFAARCEAAASPRRLARVKSTSAPPQRSLRLCGKFAPCEKVHRRVAENAEGAQRVETRHHGFAATGQSARGLVRLRGLLRAHVAHRGSLLFIKRRLMFYGYFCNAD